MSTENFPVSRETSLVPGHAHAIRSLSRQAIQMIEKQYGRIGPEPKAYHNVAHTEWVTLNAHSLAKKAVQNGNLRPGLEDLIILPAKWHDVIHVPGAKDNEHRSAVLMESQMRSSGCFTEEEIALAVDALLGIKVIEVKPDRILQSAQSRGYMARLLADADLSSLGSHPDIYWRFAKRFFEETNPGISLEGDVLLNFAQNQIRLVRGLEYLTQEARDTYNFQAQTVDFLDRQLKFA